MEVEQEADHLLAAITECTGGVVTGYVVVASFIDEDGDQRIYGNTMDDQRCHASLGLLSYGLAVEQGRAQSFHDYDD